MAVDKTSISLVECHDDNKWDSLVQSSKEANPFLMSSFLRSVGKSEDRRIIYEGNLPVIGTCFSHVLGNEAESGNGFQLYQGVFFPEIGDSNYQDDNERLRLLEILVDFIDKIGKSAVLSFHPSIRDIRGVDWYYHGNIQCNLRANQRIQYTGQIRVNEFLDFSQYTNSIRKVRLDELRKSHELNTKIVQGSDRIDHFMDLYKLTFNRQSISISDSNISQIEKIIKGSNSQGSLDIAYSKSGTPLSGIFILSDQNTDIYLYGATDPQYRKEFGSTRLILEAIERSFHGHKSIFDLCGMNSPKRGAFKASFNARVVPYFEIELASKS